MSESDRTVTRSVGIGDDLPERLWSPGDFIADGDDDESSADPRSRLVSLGFVKAAVKRRARLLLAYTAVGLVLGAGLYVAKPPSYQAATTILLNDGPNADAAAQSATDAALAQSTTVGQAVVSQLGIPGDVPTFLGSYTVATPSTQVLVITMSAPTSAEAVQRAAAVAKQFLAFRAQYTQVQQQQLEQSLNSQLSEARQNLDSLNSQIAQLQSQPSTDQQKSQLAALQVKQQAASSTLSQVQLSVTGNLVSSRAATQAMVKDSIVINEATALHHSKVKNLLLYVGGGLFGGLVLGFAIITVGALTSSRLRRRDDIAYAIGGPVRLSVGPLRSGRRLLAGKPKHRDRDMRSVVDYLRKAVPSPDSREPARLAVIAVDDARTVAQTVVSLALSSAADGRRVLLADLSDGRHAAHLLGLSQPGVQRVNSQGTHILAVVPAADDMMPTGPFPGRNASSSARSPEEKTLAEACSSAEMVLSLVTLDPSLSGDFLRTWASHAVAVVTAGESTAEKIHSIGEMVRLAGTRLDSAVLVGADTTDESLGAVTESY